MATGFIPAQTARMALVRKSVRSVLDRHPELAVTPHYSGPTVTLPLLGKSQGLVHAATLAEEVQAEFAGRTGHIGLGLDCQIVQALAPERISIQFEA